MRLKTLICLLIFTNCAWAIEFKFGPEFAVSNKEMLDCQTERPLGMENLEYRRMNCGNQVIAQKYNELEDLWQSKYIAMAAQGEELNRQVQKLINEERFKYIFPDGHYAWLGVDPSILELGHSPMTVRKIKQHKDLLQEMIFNDTKEIGLAPQMFTGGGHMNVGLEEFKDHRLLLLNFLRDLYNHPELSMGIFGYDTNNAATLRQIFPNPFSFEVATAELAGKRNKKWKFFLRDILLVLTPASDDQFLHFWNQGRDDKKETRGGNYSIVIQSSDGEVSSARMEFRAARPQVSIDQWLRMTQLIQARLDYLAQFNSLIPLEEDQIDIRREGPTKDLVSEPPVNIQKALGRFHQYVTESGLNWIDHQDYIWSKWAADGEVIVFNDKLFADCNEVFQSDTKN